VHVITCYVTLGIAKKHSLKPLIKTVMDPYLWAKERNETTHINFLTFPPRKRKWNKMKTPEL
jgi:hypothetical protein